MTAAWSSCNRRDGRATAVRPPRDGRAVYSVTREQKNLWNALKYSTAFPLVYAGYLKKHHPDEPYYTQVALAYLRPLSPLSLRPLCLRSEHTVCPKGG